MPLLEDNDMAFSLSVGCFAKTAQFWVIYIDITPIQHMLFNSRALNYAWNQ